MINKKLEEILTGHHIERMFACSDKIGRKRTNDAIKQIKEVIVSELEEHKKEGGNGKGCICGARNWSECGCDNVDWNDYELVNKTIDDIINKFKEDVE